MSDSAELQITDAEWAVMLALWDAGEQSAGQIITRVQQEREWNHRTIRTLLSRLVGKGAAHSRNEGNQYLYRPAVSREACVRVAAKSFRERFFNGNVQSLLMHFVEHEELSEAQIEQLRRTLADRMAQSHSGRGPGRRQR